MYSHKPFDCGFVILSTEGKINLLKTTVNSIKSRFPNCPFICVADGSAKTADIKEMKTICPSTYKGKSTFSSLINLGMKNAPAEWNFLVCAGAIVRWKIDEKFAFFLESEKDILFPIADGKTNFVDATLNGLCINKKTWREIGDMTDVGPIEVIKIIWATQAIEKGVKFKAIANTKFC